MAEESKKIKHLSKAERREKQRAANLLRAEKMHKARLEMAKELPLPTKPLPALNIGCSGWFYWDWKGKFYPEDMPTSQWFQHYQAHFDTVELNAPFYGWPTVGTVKGWIRQAQKIDKPFVYTVKVSELITHIHKMKRVKELVKDFGLIADLLGPYFGCFLYQFPASYTYTATRLADITRQLDHERRNVVEFRHASWWNDKVYEAFKKHGTIFCACSGPKLPDEMVRTSLEVYVRFHGPEKWYRYNYSDAELKVWADRIRKSGAKRVWAYFNNDYETHAIQNAKTFARFLKSPE
jgi:uncharacterized protein YecE (DUF72 family)